MQLAETYKMTPNQFKQVLAEMVANKVVNLNSDFQDDFNQYYGTSYDMTAGQERCTDKPPLKITDILNL